METGQKYVMYILQIIVPSSFNMATHLLMRPCHEAHGILRPILTPLIGTVTEKIVGHKEHVLNFPVQSDTGAGGKPGIQRRTHEHK